MYGWMDGIFYLNLELYQIKTGVQVLGHGEGGGVLPHMGYTGMCGPKGYGFSAILVINRVWFLHSSLDMGIFLKRSHFFVIIEKKINKSPSQIMFTVI